MKVIIISSLYGVNGGGAGIVAHNIAQGLTKAGHQISVLTTGGKHHYSMIKEQDINIFRFRPMNFYALEEKDFQPRWKKLIWQLLDIYNVHCASEFRKILLKADPDIVHIHKMRGFSGAVWSMASKLFPGRVIQTCHDFESMSPEGLLRGSIGRMALRKQWPIRGYQLIRKRLSGGVSVVTAPSSFTLKRIKDSGLFPFAQPEVIVNTHGWSRGKLESIHKKANGLAGNKVRFLFLGRLEKEKGIVELCEAFSQVFVSYPAIRLDIAGWGMLEAELRRKYGKHSGINFVGMVDGIAKEDTLHRATVVVVPSLVDEAFGLVTIEAFAFGKPVIASNIGGLPELIQHGETGWLVEAGNVQRLAEQLQFVAKFDPILLKKMGRTCKEYSQKFTVEKVLTEYLRVYNQLM